MLIAAAFCPHPPLLVPEATGVPGPGDAELARLRTACLHAVAALTAEAPDLIAVVGGASRTAEYPPDAVASLTEFGIPVTLGPAVAWWGIATAAPQAQCQALGEKIAALAPRVAVLAMGDGPGCRARGVPGAVDPAADQYDDQVAAALAEPDPGVLAALAPKAGDDLYAFGRTAWQVTAGAAGRDDFTAALGYAGVPFEVSYFVANWRRTSPPRAD